MKVAFGNHPARTCRAVLPPITALLLVATSLAVSSATVLPANRWVELARDPSGGRRSSAIRYVPAAKGFLLWGFFDTDPDLLQEMPLMRTSEYDTVFFDLESARWENHFPKAWEELWSKQLPLAYVPRTYSGITSGSERSVLRSATNSPYAAPRPDLNIVFDQVAYHPPSNSLAYFVGGLTAFYDVAKRHWSGPRPRRKAPPVLGGSLAHDPVHDELILFGGGNVAEFDSSGQLAGHAGTWIYSLAANEWRPLEGASPPPRMGSRMVLDERNGVLVLFGGDSQKHYLADTWLFDLKTRKWRKSQSSAGPPPRSGHFAIYDKTSGWVIIGGGHNRNDLSGMWAYDAGEDRWRRLTGETPTGFYISADIDPERRTIVLIANSQTPGDTTSCNVQFPVRTTYAFRIEDTDLVAANQNIPAPSPMPKALPAAPAPPTSQTASDSQPSVQPGDPPQEIPVNRWVRLDAGPAVPARTWGSAAYDTRLGRILYWGGGHCGYGGNDVDVFDVGARSWTGGQRLPEFPERAWNHGVRLAGVTFSAAPWVKHGRRTYAYDPPSGRMIIVLPVRLTAGYNPEPLRGYRENRASQQGALVSPPSSYVKYVTWSYDPSSGDWQLAGDSPPGVDTLVTTPKGVIGLTVNWPARLTDAGYSLPWTPEDIPVASVLFQFDAKRNRWRELTSTGDAPQNLYEMSSLVYDSRRNQIILHGGGARRDELWTFDLKKRKWTHRNPPVAGPAGTPPPLAVREAAYLRRHDVFLTLGRTSSSAAPAEMWAYEPAANLWRRLELASPAGVSLDTLASHNRALLYDEAKDLLLLVLGDRGNEGEARVYGMRYRHRSAQSGN